MRVNYGASGNRESNLPGFRLAASGTIEAGDSITFTTSPGAVYFVVAERISSSGSISGVSIAVIEAQEPENYGTVAPIHQTLGSTGTQPSFTYNRDGTIGLTGGSSNRVKYAFYRIMG